MFLEIILTGILFILIFAWWLGIFSKIDISEKSFPGGMYMYLDYRDKIKNMSETFKRIRKDEELF